MLVITSTSNQIIKDTAAHKSGKSCFALLEGENLVNEAIKRKINIDKLFVLKDCADEYGVILERVQRDKISVYFVSENVFKALSDTKTPQGILALVELPQKPISGPKGNFLVLDNIQDPGNMGAILRSALGAGFFDVYLLNCVSLTNPKVVRASMGTVLALDLYQTAAEQLRNMLNQTKLPLFVSDMKGKDIFSFRPPPQFGLVVGNEGSGVSDEIKKLCHEALTIPMRGGLESLNAAVAAGIIMFTLNSKK
ncbi:MAG: RNA methyltransferase [Christensenellaceae bacterium]|jgi:TrmH family RNA methyltransferase|nr:RNA methyltransferase [Christensenellaceae bacterium]